MGLCWWHCCLKPAACKCCRGIEASNLHNKLIEQEATEHSLQLDVDCMVQSRPRNEEQSCLEALVLRTPVKQLLDEVIAEGVHHQLHQVVQDLREDLPNGPGATLIKLALQEAAAILVPRQRYYLR